MSTMFFKENKDFPMNISYISNMYRYLKLKIQVEIREKNIFTPQKMGKLKNATPNGL